MRWEKIILFNLILIISTCNASLVDFLTQSRCSVKDNECQQKLYTDAIQLIAKPGLPENGIPSFEPYVVKNISIPVLGVVEIGMVDGVAKGASKCVMSRINTTIENYHSTMELVCDITIKGKYKVIGDGPLVANLLGGGSVRGDGFAKVKIDQMRIVFDFDIFLREAKGEIFIDCKYEDTHYKYDFGKVTITSLSNLFIGDQEVSQQIMPLFNANWKFITDTFSGPFVKVATDLIYDYTHKFFDVTPARIYLIETLRENYPKP